MELLVVSNKEEIKKALIVSAIIMAVLLVVALLIHITSVTDPPVHVEATREVPMEFMELNLVKDNRDGGSPGGNGSPSNDPLNKTNPPQQKEMLTSTDPNATALSSGKSKITNTDKPSNNTTTTTAQSNNPFENGGSGTGNDGGSGGLIGSDNGKGGKGTGSGTGDGNGTGKKRVRHNNISTDNIYTNSEVKVVLVLQVDESGRVVGTRTVGKETTTNDQSIINKVASACKAQLRYEKSNSMTEEYYTAVIKPQ